MTEFNKTKRRIENLSPLKFRMRNQNRFLCEIPGDKLDLPNTDSLKKIITWVLKKSLIYNSCIPSSKRVQCSPGRKRSSGDIYRIIKYYYPNQFSLEDVMETLFLFCQEPRITVTFICSTIGKRVFEFIDHYSINCHEYSTDEYGLTFYNWKTLERNQND